MNTKQMRLLKGILIILLILLVFLLFHFTKKVKRFDESNEYFRQPIESQRVELWMNPHQIKRMYHIDLEKILGKKIGPFSMEKPLSDYCTRVAIDCDELVTRLNTLKLNTPKNGH